MSFWINLVFLCAVLYNLPLLKALICLLFSANCMYVIALCYPGGYLQEQCSATTALLYNISTITISDIVHGK